MDKLQQFIVAAFLLTANVLANTESAAADTEPAAPNASLEACNCLYYDSKYNAVCLDNTEDANAFCFGPTLTWIIALLIIVAVSICFIIDFVKYVPVKFKPISSK